MGKDGDKYLEIDPFAKAVQKLVQKDKKKLKAEPNPATPKSEEPKSVAETGKVVEQSMTARNRQRKGRRSTLMSTQMQGRGGRTTTGTADSAVPGTASSTVAGGVYSTQSSRQQKLGE